MSIEVVEEPALPGEILTCGLIGRQLDFFEIRKFGTDFLFYVNKTEVTPEVYRLALDTQDKDRYCPGCMGDDDATDEHSCEAD